MPIHNNDTQGNMGLCTHVFGFFCRCWAVLDIVPQQNTCFLYQVKHNNSFHTIDDPNKPLHKPVCAQNLSLQRWVNIVIIWMLQVIVPGVNLLRVALWSSVTVLDMEVIYNNQYRSTLSCAFLNTFFPVSLAFCCWFADSSNVIRVKWFFSHLFDFLLPSFSHL